MTSPTAFSTARCDLWSTEAGDGHLPRRRRQLADVSRLLRAPDRHGHGERAGHQRRVRVHVDADQCAQGPHARWRAGGVRPAGADVPSRGRAVVQGPTGSSSRHPAPADGAGARGARRRRHHGDRPGRVGGRRHHRHRHRSPRRSGPPGDHRHRRPRQLSAGARPRRQGALQQAWRQRLRLLRRGGHRGTHRRCSVALRAVRRAARRQQRQPARCARRGGEDGGEADQHLRRPRRDLRARRRADTEAPIESTRNTKREPARTSN